MKTKLLATICLILCVFTSCDKNEVDTPDPKPNKTVKHFEAPASGYDSWLYIDLESGKTIVQKELGEWEYRQFIVENGRYKKNEKGELAYKVIETKPATGTEKDKPQKWDIAFNVHNPCVKDGEVLMTEETDIMKFTQMPNGEYKGNVPSLISVDGKRMTENIIGWAKAQINKELHKWLKSTGMGKPKIVSDKVFAVKFKNGKMMLLKFKDYVDATGKKKIVSFDYRVMTK